MDLKKLAKKQNNAVAKKDNSFKIIAEIGSSHGGDLSKAKELIAAAKEAGANIAKFQIIYADEIVSPYAGTIMLCGQNRSIYNCFKQVQVSPQFWSEVKAACEKNNIEFLASVFGTQSLKDYLELAPTKIKIASPELNYYPLLNEINQTNCEVLFSTGLATLKDVKEAYNYLKNPLVLFHCVTQYPTLENECNLKAIKTLSKKFPLIIGFSDHTKTIFEASSTAFYYGARFFEKHFTLSNKTNGLDDSFALTPKEFIKFSSTIRQLSLLTDDEIKYSLLSLIGKKRFDLLSGNSSKAPTLNEKKIYHTTRRSFVATTNIKKGDIITKQNALILRSESNKIAGIAPSLKRPTIYGAIAKENYIQGDGIKKVKFVKK